MSVANTTVLVRLPVKIVMAVTLYCSKTVYTGNGLTRTRALYHLGPPQLFRRTFKNYEKPE